MTKNHYPKIILASGSPRRHQLLAMIQWPHQIVLPSIEEKIRSGESVREYITRNSREKTDAVHHKDNPLPVLAADTVVVMEGELLEKPLDSDHARKMLKQLSNKSHIVWTSFCWFFPKHNRHIGTIVESKVTFRALSDVEITKYVASGSPMDKSGSYGIQDDLGAGFVKSIEGSYTNIVGLPLAEVIESFRQQ